jgi:hypothetical protein
MGTRFFLEGLWQQYVDTRVTFKLLAKDDFGAPKDTPSAKITATLKGPKEWEVQSLHSFSVCSLSARLTLSTKKLAFTFWSSTTLTSKVTIKCS